MPTPALIRLPCPRRPPPRPRMSNPRRNRRTRHTGFGTKRRQWLAGGHSAAPPPHRPPEPAAGNLPARDRFSVVAAPRAGRRGFVPSNGRRRSRGPRAPLGKRYPPRRSRRPQAPPASRHALRRRYARSSGAGSAIMVTATTGVATVAAIPMRPPTRKRAAHAPAARRPGQPLPRALSSPWWHPGVAPRAARRPAGKARRAICERGATQPAGMDRGSNEPVFRHGLPSWPR